MTVSLNRGMAEVTLAPSNDVTIKQIRDLVKRSGFTPKEARVKAMGRIQKKDANLVLVIGKEEYRLTPSGDAHERAEIESAKIPIGGKAEIEGIIPADLPKQPVLEVLNISISSDNPGKKEGN